jgi:hypothetical protein
MNRRMTAPLALTALLATMLTFTAASGGAATASPTTQAAAAGGSFDVWLRAGNKVHVRSSACRDLRFRVHHDGGALGDFTAQVEVWRGAKYLGQTFDYQYDASGPLRASYYWCPFDGLGKIRLGPTDVDWYSVDWMQSGSFRDGSRAAMKVKQHQKCRVTWARKARGRVRVAGKLRFYSVNKYSWRNTPKGRKVKLQRKTRHGWKTIDRARVGKRGKVRLDGRAVRKKRTYRMKQGGDRRTWACTERLRR